MMRLLAKLCLLGMPLVVLVCVELAFPINAFTFRAWEALRVTGRIVDTPLGLLFPYTTLPGPFLPHVRIARVEEGDLGHHTAFAEQHAVVWETDEFGYRIGPSSVPPELVIVGDSTVVGSGLTQKETLAEVLRREHGIGAYPFAPATMGAFLADRRFQKAPPRYVVITCVERDVLEMLETVKPSPLQVQRIMNERFKGLEIAWLRIKRLNVLAYLRARINGRPEPLEYGGVLFLKGSAAIEAPAPVRLHAAAKALVQYTAQGRERGFRLALLVVPNKETIYTNLLPEAPVPTLLPKLGSELRRNGVQVLDVESTFRTVWKSGHPVYLSDDTHWNGAAVQIAAQAIADWVRSPP